ncbi:metallophosphoesterase [Crocinitomicaceae bacterium]|nr:metallophosphoesterase [Crocinitomicaceae bacterium]
MMRFIYLTIIWLIIDLYCFQAIKTSFENSNSYIKNIIISLYWIIDIILIAIILTLYFTGKIENSGNKIFSSLFGLMIISLAPKLIILPFLLIEDIYRILSFIIQKSISFFSHSNGLIELNGRRKVISQLGLGIASIPFFSLIYGVLKGKYNYKVHHVTLKFKDLPKSFDGFKITQLSDIHSGSFQDKVAVERGVKIANELHSDLIVFTGDLVNNKAEEMEDWIPTFKKLEAPHGKLSILGNHDYGDYASWDSLEEKSKNFDRLKEIHKEIGFDLLLNSSTIVNKGGDEISIIGVENWGLRGFHKYGDLDKSVQDTPNSKFKILLSHDPSHWETITLKHEKHIHLTLSGHTHGMQFGIEVPGFIKWSPIKYIYKQWAGAYKVKDKYLYINRGFGFLGYPGRVGIMPEITQITLKRE